jgi:hypothetical protein
MIIKGLGQTESLSEVVLFPFDDYAMPLQRGLRLRLHSFKKWVDQASNIVVGLGGPGAPDNVICTYYGTVRRVGDETPPSGSGSTSAACDRRTSAFTPCTSSTESPRRHGSRVKAGPDAPRRHGGTRLRWRSAAGAANSRRPCNQRCGKMGVAPLRRRQAVSCFGQC